MPEPVTDLRTHRIRYLLRGLPIYDDDVIVGVIDETEWEWDALTEDQQAVIRQEAIRLQMGRELDWDAAFTVMLGEYGIRCPHKWENHEPSWRECRWCYAMEQLPGRIVRVGGQTMRVADPPPPVLKVPVMATASLVRVEPSASPDGPDFDEYRWTGKRYESATVTDAPPKENHE